MRTRGVADEARVSRKQINKYILKNAEDIYGVRKQLLVQFSENLRICERLKPLVNKCHALQYGSHFLHLCTHCPPHILSSPCSQSFFPSCHSLSGPPPTASHRHSFLFHKICKEYSPFLSYSNKHPHCCGAKVCVFVLK